MCRTFSARQILVGALYDVHQRLSTQEDENSQKAAEKISEAQKLLNSKKKSKAVLKILESDELLNLKTENNQQAFFILERKVTELKKIASAEYYRIEWD